MNPFQDIIVALRPTGPEAAVEARRQHPAAGPDEPTGAMMGFSGCDANGKPLTSRT